MSEMVRRIHDILCLAGEARSVKSQSLASACIPAPLMPHICHPALYQRHFRWYHAGKGRGLAGREGLPLGFSVCAISEGVEVHMQVTMTAALGENICWLKRLVEFVRHGQEIRLDIQFY